jgi:hypothetical protein
MLCQISHKRLQGVFYNCIVTTINGLDVSINYDTPNTFNSYIYIYSNFL